jgi:hypothetical protein
VLHSLRGDGIDEMRAQDPDGAFDKPMTKNEVLEAVKPFFV